MNNLSKIISTMLQINDPNISFVGEPYTDKYKGKITVIYNACLTYKEKCCPICKVKNSIVKNGSKITNVRMLSVNGYGCLIKLKKQRFLCKHCKKTHIAETNIINKYDSISKRVKQNILLNLAYKISEKEIGMLNNVSHQTVYNSIEKNVRRVEEETRLSENLSFDEFKSTKDSRSSMSFIFASLDEFRTLNILDSRRSFELKKYFRSFPLEQLEKVKTITIDMYKPYIHLIEQTFPNADIIFDRFHIINNLSRALNKTRVEIMKDIPTHTLEYKRLKKYWRLILKDSNYINTRTLKKWTYFTNFYTSKDVVENTISIDMELNNTYEIYQVLLNDIRNKDIISLKKHLAIGYNFVSPYMKKSILFLIENFKYVSNALKYKYSNGFIEGTNNLIKTIKKVAFGYKKFTHFRNRIFIVLRLRYLFNL